MIDINNFDWGWMNNGTEGGDYHKYTMYDEIFVQRLYEKFFDVEEVKEYCNQNHHGDAIKSIYKEVYFSCEEEYPVSVRDFPRSRRCMDWSTTTRACRVTAPSVMPGTRSTPVCSGCGTTTSKSGET